SPQNVSVTLNVTSASLSASPSQLSFTHVAGAAAPAAKTIQVSSAAASDFTVGVSGGGWLSANPASGTTPASVSVSVDPSGLAPGVYNGSVTISPQAAGPAPQVVAVSLTVSAASLTLSTTQLSFSAQIGGSSPAARSVSVSAAAPTSFTAEVTLGAFLS